MNNKKTVKNIKTPNKFEGGGEIFKENFRTGFSEAMGLSDGSSFKDMFSAENLGKSLGAALPGMTGVLGGVAGGLISDGFSTTGGQILSGVGDVAMLVNPFIGGAIKLASGLVNRAAGTKWDNEGLAKAEGQVTGLNNFQSGASDYNTLAKDFTRIGSMNKTIKASDLGEDGWFVNRTKEKANELNTDLGNAYNYAMRNVNNVADNIAGSTLDNLERNYAAFGGLLPRKKFAYGGQTHGADFTNGLMFIDNGGTHESNPYEGIPISMDQEGNPNLVEEGEVIWNDYVFSNRLKVPKSIQKKYKLGKREMTFANAVDKLSKESEERPNDPISMRGLENVLMNMAMEQEFLKAKNNTKREGNKFNTGGPFGEAKSPFKSKGVYITGWLDAVKALTLDEYNRYAASNGLPTMTQAQFDELKGKATDKVDGDNHTAMWNALNWLHSNPVNNLKVEDLTLNDYNRYLRANHGVPVTEDIFNARKTGNSVGQDVLDWVFQNPQTSNTTHKIRIPQEDGTYTYVDIEAPYEGASEFHNNGSTWANQYNYITPYGKSTFLYKDADGIDQNVQYYDISDMEAFKLAHPEVSVYEAPITEDTAEGTETTRKYPTKDTWMRYAPIAGHALSLAHNLANDPDYSNAEAIIKASQNLSANPIKFNPIGDFMTYNPFDTEYHANQLRSVAGATRRNIMNTSGGNRAAAMAGILASDNNTMNQMGDLYRKAAEYNLEQKQKVATFNRATNQFNSEGAFRADQANQAAKQAGLDGIIRGYMMKEQTKALRDQAINNSVSGLFQSFGDVGRENFIQNQINWRTAAGVDGPGTETYWDDISGLTDWRARRAERKAARQAKKAGNQSTTIE